MKYITPKMILGWYPCPKYDRARIEKLFGRRKRATIREILRAPIPPEDALWVVLREELIPAKTLRLFACACAERALRRERKTGRKPNRASVNAVRVARRYAVGKATAEELSAARSAAWLAVWSMAEWAARSVTYLAAESAARSATRSAAESATCLTAGAAARSTTKSAACSAAGSVESKWQIATLLKMLAPRKR